MSISVRGHSEARCAPERATVHFSVSIDGPEREPVRQRAALLASELNAELAGHGNAVEWNSESLSIWSDRPWSQDGQQLDPIYHANVSFTATTGDFDLLAGLLDRLGERDGVTVHHVSWALTDETRLRVERELAVVAVAEATARAEAYAAALGLRKVAPVELADAGLLGAGNQKLGSYDMMARSVAGMDSQVELKPSEILVSAGVEMRFEAWASA